MEAHLNGARNAIGPKALAMGEGNRGGTAREDAEGGFGATKTARTAGDEEGLFSWGTGHAVEPWPEPVNGEELLEDLQRFLRRYVVLGRWAGETLALWVVHTHAFRLRDVTTYIGLESPQKRCGKTTLLTVMGEVVNRPIVASNISSPAFFRVIQEARPTLLIDEADTLLHGNPELRGILNCGYKRKTAYVVRVVSQKENDKFGDGSPGSGAGGTGGQAPEGEQGNGRADWLVEGGGGTRLGRFSSWCPKAIATIRHLPETLADRCVVIQMNRKRQEEPCERLRGMNGTELRRKCARFVLDHEREIAGAEPVIPPDLHDRAGEIWEPLLVLADLAGGSWPGLAREAAIGLTAGAQEESAMGALLFDIMLCFMESGMKRLFSRVLTAQLNGMGERPWSELKRGKEITEIWLAKQLRPYEARPKTIWIGKELAKGYLKADFDEIVARYLSKGQARALLEELAAKVRPEADQPPAGQAEELRSASAKRGEAETENGPVDNL